MACSPRGRRSRRIWAKALAGGAAGLASYLLLLPIHSPWEEALAASLIGGAPGLVDGAPRRSWLGGCACLTGWLMGSLLFGLRLELGIGAWILAGGFLAATASAFDGPTWRMVPALLAGALAGLAAEASRYLTLVSVAVRDVDMQLLVLIVAGLLLPAVAAVAAPPGDADA
jgi:hypothetical protein